MKALLDTHAFIWAHKGIRIATARRLGAALVTADTAILEYAAQTKAVRVIEI